MGKENGERSLTLKTAIHMKGVTKTIRKMAWVNLSGKVGTFTMVCIKMMKEMVTEKCFGLMVLVIKESGKKAYSMELVGWSSLMEELKKACLRTMCSKGPLKHHSSSN